MKLWPILAGALIGSAFTGIWYPTVIVMLSAATTLAIAATMSAIVDPDDVVHRSLAKLIKKRRNRLPKAKVVK